MSTVLVADTHQAFFTLHIIDAVLLQLWKAPTVFQGQTEPIQDSSSPPGDGCYCTETADFSTRVAPPFLGSMWVQCFLKCHIFWRTRTCRRSHTDTYILLSCLLPVAARMWATPAGGCWQSASYSLSQLPEHPNARETKVGSRLWVLVAVLPTGCEAGFGQVKILVAGSMWLPALG